MRDKDRADAAVLHNAVKAIAEEGRQGAKNAK
jgi:hypothetical protein